MSVCGLYFLDCFFASLDKVSYVVHDFHELCPPLLPPECWDCTPGPPSQCELVCLQLLTIK
jgi:hypothetical protein